jgi:hypothetical protein
MATTNHPKTFADLYTTVLNNVRADSSVTATVAEAKRMVNTALHDIHLTSGEKFTWAHRRDTIRTHPKYETGTVDLTQGSTSVSGSSTDWTGSDAFGDQNVRVGGKLVTANGQEVYRVTAVGSATGLTLDQPWVDDTSTGVSYTYFEDEYALASDFLRPLSLRSFDLDDGIRLIGKMEFEGYYPRNKTTGQVSVATILDLPFSGDTTPVRKVRFHKPPDQAYLIPYWYVTSNLAVSSAGSAQVELSADTDEPIVPLSFRMMIVHHALAQWFSDRMDDLQRSSRHDALYQNILNRALLQNEFGKDRPKIRPRIGPMRAASRRPYVRGRGGKHTLGSAFDELRD